MSIDQRPRTHVVFSGSLAGTLRHVLSDAGRDEEVIGFLDNLSFGPIALTPRERAEWIEREFGYEDWKEVSIGDEIRWRKALSPTCRIVAWVHRRCTVEFSGFLEFLSRIGDAEFGVVDLTDANFGNKPGVVINASGVIGPQEFAKARAYEWETTLSSEQLAAYRQSWARLKTENASLRVLTGDGLLSAPITYFDDVISCYVGDDWTNCARVIGSSLVDSTIDCDFAQTGDIVLWARLRHLCETGRFEHKGDLADMHRSHVRRRQHR